MNRIDPDFFLGGRIRLDIEKSRKVITEKVAKPLGLTMEEAASAMRRRPISSSGVWMFMYGIPMRRAIDGAWS